MCWLAWAWLAWAAMGHPRLHAEALGVEQEHIHLAHSIAHCYKQHTGTNCACANLPAGKATPGTHGILGVAPVGSAGGHVAVFGDSNCLDSSHQQSACYEFLARLLERVVQVRASLQLPFRVLCQLKPLPMCLTDCINLLASLQRHKSILYQRPAGQGQRHCGRGVPAGRGVRAPRGRQAACAQGRRQLHRLLLGPQEPATCVLCQRPLLLPARWGHWAAPWRGRRGGGGRGHFARHGHGVRGRWQQGLYCAFPARDAHLIHEREGRVVPGSRQRGWGRRPRGRAEEGHCSVTAAAAGSRGGKGDRAGGGSQRQWQRGRGCCRRQQQQRRQLGAGAQGWERAARPWPRQPGWSSSGLCSGVVSHVAVCKEGLEEGRAGRRWQSRVLRQPAWGCTLL